MLKEPKFIKAASSTDFDWSNFINHINIGITAKSNQPASDMRVGNLRFWDRLTITTDYATEDVFPGIEALSRLLNPSGFAFKTVMSVMSLTTSEKTTGKHFDGDDVVYFQCIGSVLWTVWYNDTSTDFILNPGDAIYVPAFLEHHVQSLSPRAALSFIYAPGKGE